VRWIVDGMNVIGARPDRWRRNRRRALTALVENLETCSAAEGHDVTVVFEKALTPPLDFAVISLALVPAAAPSSADNEIVRLVQSDDRPAELCVVASDRTLVDWVSAAGPTFCPSTRFRDVIDPR
jgi:predicted RNA-binding protein with PIN domain